MTKIIHQTWKDGESVEWIPSVKSAFKGYEYKFWTDEENDALVKDNHPEWFDFYKNELIKISQLDFTRLLYIYHYGGIYLDVDVKMNKPLELEGADVYLCDQTEEANDSIDRWPLIIDPFFYAGEKGCPFFYDVCNSIVRGNIYRLLSQKITKKYFRSLYQTGPFLLTKFYMIYGHRYKIKVLKDVFTTKYHKSLKPQSEYHGVHMHMNSWMKPEDRRS